jgi:hypothetical protein
MMQRTIPLRLLLALPEAFKEEREWHATVLDSGALAADIWQEIAAGEKPGDVKGS